MYQVKVIQQTDGGGYTRKEELVGMIPDYEMLTSLMGILPEVFDNIEIIVIPNNHDDNEEE